MPQILQPLSKFWMLPLDSSHFSPPPRFSAMALMLPRTPTQASQRLGAPAVDTHLSEHEDPGGQRSTRRALGRCCRSHQQLMCTP